MMDSGPLCDLLEYHLGMCKNKSIVVEFPNGIIDHDPFIGQKPSLPTEYRFVEFEYGRVIFQTKNFEYANNWTDSSYLICTPMAKTQEDEKGVVYSLWLGVVYVDQYARVNLSHVYKGNAE